MGKFSDYPIWRLACRRGWRRAVRQALAGAERDRRRLAVLLFAPEAATSAAARDGERGATAQRS
jgi:hypothetical protein